MFDKKVSQIESKIEKVIDKKLGDKMGAVNYLNEKFKDKDGKESYSKFSLYPPKYGKLC